MLCPSCERHEYCDYLGYNASEQPGFFRRLFRLILAVLEGE